MRLVHSEKCEPCTQYQRGERENFTAMGVTVHVCAKKREGEWGFGQCLCRCVQRPVPKETESV